MDSDSSLDMDQPQRGTGPAVDNSSQARILTNAVLNGDADVKAMIPRVTTTLP